MNTFNNVVSFAGSVAAQQQQGPIFPALNETAFNAEFRPIYSPVKRDQYADSVVKIPESIGRAVVRTDNDDVLGVVGKSYGIAQNQGLQSVVAEACENVLPRNYLQGIKLKETTSSNGAFTKFTYEFPNAAQPIKQMIRSLAGNHISETVLNFRVSVVNSFSGRTPVILQAGAVDLVCLNGMVLSNFDTEKRRHTSGYSPEVFGEFLKIQAAQYITRVQTWQQWAESQITPDQAETTLVDAGISPRLTKQLMDQMHVEVQKRGQTIWALYSALTYYSSHNSDTFTVKGSSTRDNVAETLYRRSSEVARVVGSRPWAALTGRAA